MNEQTCAAADNQNELFTTNFADFFTEFHNVLNQNWCKVQLTDIISETCALVLIEDPTLKNKFPHLVWSS
jgi:hypothetical protein